MYHLMNHWAREGYVRFQMPSITVCIFQSCMIFFHLNFVGSKDLPSVRCEHLINFGVKNCAGYENATGTVNDKSVPMYDVSPTQLNNTGKRQNNSDLPTIMEPTFSIIGIGVVIFGFVAFGITTVILHKKNILPKHFYFPSKDRNDPLTRNPLNRTVEIFDV
ncbi:uncharacterized protein LOC133186370 [Saccostrea echinata]|uniref:uncharacterized protein LOC133186370 n=1 Tax=Saccostrea echinata TaxID=191078 RepID=UPI002A8394B9|nr:uncharacterized protein LOC133186370 [Saccostrea echinata]